MPGIILAMHYEIKHCKGTYIENGKEIKCFIVLKNIMHFEKFDFYKIFALISISKEFRFIVQTSYEMYKPDTILQTLCAVQIALFCLWGKNKLKGAL